MNITKEEKVKIMVDRITYQRDVTPGGGNGGRVYEQVIAAERLASILVELLK